MSSDTVLITSYIWLKAQFLINQITFVAMEIEQRRHFFMFYVLMPARGKEFCEFHFKMGCKVICC